MPETNHDASQPVNKPPAANQQKNKSQLNKGEITARQYTRQNPKIRGFVREVAEKHLRKEVGAVSTKQKYDAEYSAFIKKPTGPNQKAKEK